MKKVAIQGYPGAFHEIAARRFYADEIEVVPADTFDDVVSFVDGQEKADSGLMAIENSISGGLLRNHYLINHSSLQIVGEIYLRIKQNLLALPGTKIEDLLEVHSHPMAIAQSKRYFKSHPHIKLVETRDTAESARDIQANNWTHIGGVASTLAAEMYGLEVLQDSIETNKKNYTRFIVLNHFMDSGDEHEFDKVSVSFAVSHENGSLYRALKALSDQGANMTKIQSTPIPGRPWEYLFFVDFLLDDVASFGQVFQHLGSNTRGLKVLGKYKSGNHHED